jgi:hypothetical protein
MRDENKEIGRSIGGGPNVLRGRLMARHGFQKTTARNFHWSTSHTALKKEIASIVLANGRHETATSIRKDRWGHHGC